MAAFEKDVIMCFASMRFGGGSPKKAILALKEKLKPHGIDLVVYDDKTGNIKVKVEGMMERCYVFLACGTKHYGVKTSSNISSFEEVEYWQEYKSDATIVRLRMISFEEKHDPGAARGLFKKSNNQILWLFGTPLTDSIVNKIAEAIKEAHSVAGGGGGGGGVAAAAKPSAAAPSSKHSPVAHGVKPSGALAPPVDAASSAWASLPSSGPLNPLEGDEVRFRLQDKEVVGIVIKRNEMHLRLQHPAGTCWAEVKDVVAVHKAAAAPNAASEGKLAKMAFPFAKTEDWQISASAGEAITVMVDSGNGWVDAVNAAGERGFIPKNYLKPDSEGGGGGGGLSPEQAAAAQGGGGGGGGPSSAQEAIQNSPKGGELGQELIEEVDNTACDLGKVKELVDKGASVKEKDWAGCTALHCAAANGHAKALTVVLDAGADKDAKNIDGSTALHVAADMGHADALTVLLDAGADIEAKGKNGSTALHQAANMGHAEALTVLLDAGADIEAKNVGGNTARDLAILPKLNQWREVVKLLDAHAGGRAPGIVEM